MTHYFCQVKQLHPPLALHHNNRYVAAFFRHQLRQLLEVVLSHFLGLAHDLLDEDFVVVVEHLVDLLVLHRVVLDPVDAQQVHLDGHSEGGRVHLLFPKRAPSHTEGELRLSIEGPCYLRHVLVKDAVGMLLPVEVLCTVEAVCLHAEV